MNKREKRQLLDDLLQKGFASGRQFITWENSLIDILDDIYLENEKEIDALILYRKSEDLPIYFSRDYINSILTPKEKVPITVIR